MYGNTNTSRLATPLGYAHATGPSIRPVRRCTRPDDGDSGALSSGLAEIDDGNCGLLESNPRAGGVQQRNLHVRLALGRGDAQTAKMADVKKRTREARKFTADLNN